MSLPIRLAISLSVMAIVLALLNYFVLKRTVSTFQLSRRAAWVLGFALGVPFATTLFFRGFGSSLPLSFGQPVAVFVSSAQLGVGIAAGLLGIAALVRRLGVFARHRSQRSVASALPGDTTKAEAANPDEAPLAPPISPSASSSNSSPTTSDVAVPIQSPKPDAIFTVSRRVFVEKAVTTSALAVGGFSSAYGAIFGRHDYELSTVAVPIRGLSKAADNFTIVQLSDIHLGLMVGEPEMRAAEELARKARGNLIVLTGDLVDHDPRYNERLGLLVRRLSEISPVVAIPGNHDYYTGIQGVISTLQKAGATVLVNQATTILGENHGFTLAGLDDFSGLEMGGGPDLPKALSEIHPIGSAPSRPTIVLAHNPRTFEETAGNMALQLSGHTHGGQVNLGFRMANVVLRHGYVAGLYETKGSHIYVNRGFGTAGPAARVGAPPEVSRIVLVSA